MKIEENLWDFALASDKEILPHDFLCNCIKQLSEVTDGRLSGDIKTIVDDERFIYVMRVKIFHDEESRKDVLTVIHYRISDIIHIHLNQLLPSEYKYFGRTFPHAIYIDERPDCVCSTYQEFETGIVHLLKTQAVKDIIQSLLQQLKISNAEDID